MKIIIVHVGDILKYPPVVSLINALENNNIDTTVITTKSDIIHEDFQNIKFEDLGFRYESLSGPLQKFFNIFHTRSKIDALIRKYYKADSIIWITYNVSLKHMNIKRLYQYRYVMQLMELTESIKFHKKLPIKLDSKQIANRALAVVVPEYNRAHITRAWWDLKDMPLILPNKPYYGVEYPRNAKINDPYAMEIIEKLRNKKIILYQGILSMERPLDVVIKAVDKLGEDYAFVVMSGGQNIYKGIESRNYYFIPFVAPPEHLQVTSHAFIGVLAYIPVESEFSKLNVLYCAPNKTFEYGMFGIPMIGNDLPGLRFLFDTNNCGKCFDEFEVDQICHAIQAVERDYDEMSRNARKYYEETDYNQIVCNILRILNNKL